MDDDIIFQILSGNDEEPKEETENPNIEEKPEENNSLSKVDQEIKEQQEKEQNYTYSKNEEQKIRGTGLSMIQEKNDINMREDEGGIYGNRH